MSDRFLREAQSAGQLRHPGIAAVYEAGQDQGFAYQASEYVPGQTLGRPPRCSTFSATGRRSSVSWAR